MSLSPMTVNYECPFCHHVSKVLCDAFSPLPRYAKCHYCGLPKAERPFNNVLQKQSAQKEHIRTAGEFLIRSAEAEDQKEKDEFLCLAGNYLKELP